MNAQHLTTIEAIDGLCSMAELKALYLLAQGLNRASARIVEVGSYKGKSTVALALGAPLAEILAVDLWHLNADPKSVEYTKKETLEAFLENTKTLPNIRHRVGELSAEDLWPEPSLVFIDGDHRYDGVSANIQRVLACVPKATLVAFHDFCPGKPYGEGVFQAYLEHRRRFRTLAQVERLLIAEVV